jgi:hypothetical protein
MHLTAYGINGICCHLSYSSENTFNRTWNKVQKDFSLSTLPRCVDESDPILSEE